MWPEEKVEKKQLSRRGDNSREHHDQVKPTSELSVNL